MRQNSGLSQKRLPLASCVTPGSTHPTAPTSAASPVDVTNLREAGGAWRTFWRSVTRPLAPFPHPSTPKLQLQTRHIFSETQGPQIPVLFRLPGKPALFQPLPVPTLPLLSGTVAPLGFRSPRLQPKTPPPLSQVSSRCAERPRHISPACGTRAGSSEPLPGVTGPVTSNSEDFLCSPLAAPHNPTLA